MRRFWKLFARRKPARPEPFGDGDQLFTLEGGISFERDAGINRVVIRGVDPSGKPVANVISMDQETFDEVMRGIEAHGP